jgi:hypothetical protein
MTNKISLRKIKYSLWVNLNWVTSPIRFKPSCMIIGTQKGGTTSLYDALTQNPLVGKGLNKELHFFNQPTIKNEYWYRAYFPMMYLNKKHFYIDATPQYLCHPFVAERIAKWYPNMKFIVLLRNPIDRAYSHYFHEKRKCRENRTFEQAIQNCMNQPESDIVQEASKSVKEPQQDYQFLNYLNRGKYVEQLEHWFQFFPREQFLILSSEFFYSNSYEATKQISNFLQLPFWEKTKFEIKNSGGSYEKISLDLRQELNRYFSPYNERLYRLLNVNYDWK